MLSACSTLRELCEGRSRKLSDVLLQSFSFENHKYVDTLEDVVADALKARMDINYGTYFLCHTLKASQKEQAHPKKLLMRKSI